MELASLQSIVRLLEGDERVVLVYPVAREGSVPTPRDALMIVHEDGISGTVGGGILESEAIEEARRMLATGGHTLLWRTLDANDVADDQMLCGGAVMLLVESVAPDAADVWSAVEHAVLRGSDHAWLCRVSRAENQVKVERLPVPPGEPSRRSFTGLEDPGAGAGAMVVRSMTDGFELVDRVVVPDTLLVFGGGHVALALVPIASGLGFRCWVADDRAEYASKERFPEAYRVVVADPAGAVSALPSGPHVWAAVMTRGHKDDARVLAMLLRDSYRYIGLIGSARKKAMLWAELEAQGASREALDAVHCPIGLPIGGSTPHEIAVSIAAELVAERHRSPAATRPRG